MPFDFSDDDTVAWLAVWMTAADAALVMWRGHHGAQPVLFPRSLCRGKRLHIDTHRKTRKRKR